MNSRFALILNAASIAAVSLVLSACEEKSTSRYQGTYSPSTVNSHFLSPQERADERARLMRIADAARARAKELLKDSGYTYGMSPAQRAAEGKRLLKEADEAVAKAYQLLNSSQS